MNTKRAPVSRLWNSLRGGRPTPHLVVPPVYRRHPWAAALIALAVSAAVADHLHDHQGQDYTRYHNREFTVARVVDGDTFDIDIPDGRYPTTRIRLWGVDTPEVAGSKAGAMYYGAEASAFAKHTLTGRRVRLVLSPTKTRGLYGRLLAYVYTVPDNQCFNELLITRGFGYADWRFRHPFKIRYRLLEERARRQGVGLWAGVTLEQMPAWRQRMEQHFSRKGG